jgi:hypothetical protein
MKATRRDETTTLLHSITKIFGRVSFEADCENRPWWRAKTSFEQITCALSK